MDFIKISLSEKSLLITGSFYVVSKECQTQQKRQRSARNSKRLFSRASSLEEEGGKFPDLKYDGNTLKRRVFASVFFPSILLPQVHLSFMDTSTSLLLIEDAEGPDNQKKLHRKESLCCLPPYKLSALTCQLFLTRILPVWHSLGKPHKKSCLSMGNDFFLWELPDIRSPVSL